METRQVSLNTAVVGVSTSLLFMNTLLQCDVTAVAMALLARALFFAVLFHVMKQLLMFHVVKTSLKHPVCANLDPEESTSSPLSPRSPHSTGPAADFHMSVTVPGRIGP